MQRVVSFSPVTIVLEPWHRCGYKVQREGDNSSQNRSYEHIDRNQNPNVGQYLCAKSREKKQLTNRVILDYRRNFFDCNGASNANNLMNLQSPAHAHDKRTDCEKVPFLQHFHSYIELFSFNRPLDFYTISFISSKKKPTHESLTNLKIFCSSSKIANERKKSTTEQTTEKKNKNLNEKILTSKNNHRQLRTENENVAHTTSN